MHRKVLKISSGGVHNICIVHDYPNSLSYDIFKQFVLSNYSDLTFKFTDVDGKGTEVDIRCHKFVIAARSGLFGDQLRELPQENNVLEVTDFSFLPFKCLIEYLYTDDTRIVENIKECDMLVEILKLSKLHKLPKLLE
jgi:hypothetical protein